MLRFLLREGHDTYLVDWGSPSPTHRDEDLAQHVEALLLPLLAHFERPPILIGYCLGGTLAIGAATRQAAKGRPPQALATIAAPWDFAQYSADFREKTAAIWVNSRATCDQLGLVPMEVLQSGFWSLDPARTIRKYADFLDLDEDSQAYRGFITVEDWANEGAPLTYGVGHDLIEQFYGANLPGQGQWRIGNTLVEPAALSCPTLAIASTTDVIVPAAATPMADERIDLDLGHVGMMIGGRAQTLLWTPLSEWIRRQGG